MIRIRFIVMFDRRLLPFPVYKTNPIAENYQKDQKRIMKRFEFRYNNTI